MIQLLLAALPLPALADPGVDFSEPRGWTDSAFSLSLSAEEGGTLYYSLDGSEPSLPYAAPLDITGTSVVRAKEVASDGTESEVETNTYLFVADIVSSAVMDTRISADATYGPLLEETLRTVPSVSLVLPGALSTAEQEASAEWLDPDGENEQINCGVKMTGTTSLAYPKPSIRLMFRGEYGESKLDLELYTGLYDEGRPGIEPADSFDAINLRSGNHDTVFYLGAAGQHLRNFWMDESLLEMGRLNPHGRFVHLYVNGSYAGVYHLRERLNAAFMASYLGGDKDDYEAVNGGTVVDGSGGAWASLAASTTFSEASAWLDVPQFLDYMVLSFYAGNAWDWSAYHNWAAAGPAEANAGGFRFQSSDSDICLYYGYTVNILSNPGPAYLFGTLLAEGDPDFLVALQDSIYRNLSSGGPLDADVAAARYARLAEQAEGPLVAESARWGLGWWDVGTEWVTERDRLLYDWFPYRTDELLRQMDAAGWTPLDAPVLSEEPGIFAAGTEISAALPDGSEAELWVSVDGEDPRQSGGEPSASALGPSVLETVSLEHSTWIRARLREGETWGPLVEGFYEVDEAPPVVLNEWNAVDDDETLKDEDFEGSGADDALGTREGNGGDWVELLVLEDGLDLRGWRITMSDRGGKQGDLQFTDDPVLAELRAGTILTIAEDLPEDTSYDPDGGDWRFHLRAASDGTGQAISAADFEVTSRDWQLVIWDTTGHLRFGPAGEGISPQHGIGDDEVGLLADDPSTGLRRDAAGYTAGSRSTYGAPNRWADGVQDLSSLRGEPAPVYGDTAGEPDTHPTEETGDPEDSAREADTGGKTAPGGCGCSHAKGGAGSGALALFMVLLTRRRRSRAALLLGGMLGCTADKGVVPEDTGTPADSDSAETAETAETDSGPACFSDADLDGYGDPASPATCGSGAVRDNTDCDDGDRSVHPDAPEVCDGLDDDCDGLADDADTVVDGLPFYTDADGDGYGEEGTIILACEAGADAALDGGDCDDADPAIHPGADEICDEIDQNCDGTASDALGSSLDCAASSCREIAEAGATEDGPRWVTLPSGETTELYCDLSTDGGGWTLGFLRNTASTGSQGEFGGSDTSVADLSVSPAEASASSTARLAWLDLNAYDWEDLRLGAYASGSATYLSRDIPRTELRIDFGEDGYLLFGGETGYYWCGGNASYTDGGVGAVNNPDGATSDCKGHGSLGSGWDFSESDYANAGLTLCGGDGSYFLAASWGGSWTGYGAAGGAQAIWVR